MGIVDNDLLDGRLKILRMVVEEAPPRPACFDTDRQWQEYLVVCFVSGVPVLRRLDIGKHTGNRVTRTVFAIRADQHCRDCAIGSPYQLRMVEEGRCEFARRKQAIADAAAHTGQTPKAV